MSIQSRIRQTVIPAGVSALVVAGLFAGSHASTSKAQAGQAPQPMLESPAGIPGSANIFVDLAKRAVPSVVNISTMTTLKPRYAANPFSGGSNAEADEIFKRFFDGFFSLNPGLRTPHGSGFGGVPAPPHDLPKSASLGTGFLIEPGIVLTNYHVISGADEIKIQFTEAKDEAPTEGQVIGKDPDLDIALIRVHPKGEIPPLPLGDSEQLEVGEYVMAVGNPFGQGHSVTHGIISAKGRSAPGIPLTHYLQTDAPINPGNSGGPLLNLKGEVVGINNAIDARAQGIGFAIPINAVKAVLGQLRTEGKVSRGYLGVAIGAAPGRLADAAPSRDGVFVAEVYPGTPAAKAGLEARDSILDFDGQAVHSPEDLMAAVSATPVGKRVDLKISRAGRNQNFSVKIEEKPERTVTASHPQNEPQDDESQRRPSIPGFSDRDG
jgi:serine protease Do